MATEYETSADYIQHHLTNLTYGRFPNGDWGFARGQEDINSMGFWAINVDTMFWSLSLGLIFLGSFSWAAKKQNLEFQVGSKTSASMQ